MANYPPISSSLRDQILRAYWGCRYILNRGKHQAWDVHYNSGAGTFTKTQFILPGTRSPSLKTASLRLRSWLPSLVTSRFVASDPDHPVTGVFTFTATIFTFNSGPIEVPVGQCSGSIQVPSGAVTVTETPVLGVAVSDVTAIAYDEFGFQHNELNSWTQPDLNAIVNAAGGRRDGENAHDI